MWTNIFSGIIITRIKIFNRDYDSLNDYNTDLFPDGDEDDVQEGTSNENEDYDLDDLENILNKKDSDDYLGIGKLKIPSTYKFYTIVVNVFMLRYLVSGDCNGMSVHIV